MCTECVDVEFLSFVIFSAPFTIQRLCELLVHPTKHYKTTDKFLRAIEKVKQTYSDPLQAISVS